MGYPCLGRRIALSFLSGWAVGTGSFLLSVYFRTTVLLLSRRTWVRYVTTARSTNSESDEPGIEGRVNARASERHANRGTGHKLGLGHEQFHLFIQGTRSNNESSIKSSTSIIRCTASILHTHSWSLASKRCDYLSIFTGGWTDRKLEASWIASLGRASTDASAPPKNTSLRMIALYEPVHAAAQSLAQHNVSKKRGSWPLGCFAIPSLGTTR